MGIARASDFDLCRLIDRATQRVVFAAPSVDEETAWALCRAFQRLGSDSVAIILDPDPEVFRLGYGTFEAFEVLQAEADKHKNLICREPGLRIGVVISDERIAFYAPIPKLVSEPIPSVLKNGLGLSLSGSPQEIAKELGAGPTGRQDQKFGLEGVSNSLADEVRRDLKANPPVKFDVARQMRVFNAFFEFVEWEVEGCKLSSKKVTIPSEFLALISDPAARRRMQTQYALVEASDKIMKGQSELESLRRDIDRRFLKQIAGYGKVVLRREREAFDHAYGHFKDKVSAFAEMVQQELETSIQASILQLAASLAPTLENSQPAKYQRSREWDPSLTMEEFLRDELQRVFRTASFHVSAMKTTLIYKGVTYESLTDETFKKEAQKAFPELEIQFEEHVTATGPKIH